MAFKILKGGLELKHILNILQCVHYNKNTMKRVTKLRSRKSCKTRAETFFRKKMLHPIFRTFLQKFPYIIEGIRVKLEAGICFVNLFIACTILNFTI